MNSRKDERLTFSASGAMFLMGPREKMEGEVDCEKAGCRLFVLSRGIFNCVRANKCSPRPRRRRSSAAGAKEGQRIAFRAGSRFVGPDSGARRPTNLRPNELVPPHFRRTVAGSRPFAQLQRNFHGGFSSLERARRSNRSPGHDCDHLSGRSVRRRSSRHWQAA